MQIRAAVEADAPAIACVHVNSWRTTYAGLIPADFLASLSYESREAWWRQALLDPTRASFVYVAELAPGKDIVGFACGGREREGHPNYTGELYAIYLLQVYQRRGIGRSLVAVSANELLARGLGSMLIWVLADNPATRFYAALGGQPVGEKSITIGGASLKEVAYGWRDLEPVAKLHGPSSLGRQL